MEKATSDLLEFDENIEFKLNNDFAKNYDNWRRKEELNKVKLKYGDINLEDTESSTSEDDEDGEKLTEEVEKTFFKTLSCLKKKDPKIYDSKTRFFNDEKDEEENEIKVKPKKKKEQPMYLKDYERKLLLENNGIITDEEDNVEEIEKKMPISTNREKEIKDEIKLALSTINANDDEDDLIFTRKHDDEKTKKKPIETKTDYKSWLTGQTNEIKDAEIKSDLKPLKDFWTDPNLDEGERFLRDYVLNKKYLETERTDYIPSYDEIVHDSDEGLSEDEKELERQEDFEYKYNYRFEEPDPEFIKRYPRTIENSLRKSDNRRKIKRTETKLRKQQEKEMKMAEIDKLKELKRKEIEEKIEKLKEITGNTDVGFFEKDLDKDFDPEIHDKKMEEIFSNDFYAQPEDDQKPQFPDLDAELEIENWDNWEAIEADIKQQRSESHEAPHIDDDDFNMDADYDPSAPKPQKQSETRRGKKGRRKKSKIAEALSKPKPKYNPENKNFKKYFDEYYKLDCEDIIGDLPCRFKYRQVEPNNFGLTMEEILLAKDRELNRWCSLKKAVQYRPENVEKYDRIAYEKKAKNLALKKKILPSLFVEEEENTESATDVQENNSTKYTQILNTQKPATKKQNKLKNEVNETSIHEDVHSKLDTDIATTSKNQSNKVTKKKRKIKKAKNQRISNETDNFCQVGDENTSNNDESKLNLVEKEINTSKDLPFKTKKTRKIEAGTDQHVANEMNNLNNKRKRKNSKGEAQIKKEKRRIDIGISDARLTAYGINPKKFKNKLKYKKN